MIITIIIIIMIMIYDLWCYFEDIFLRNICNLNAIDMGLIVII